MVYPLTNHSNLELACISVLCAAALPFVVAVAKHTMSHQLPSIAHSVMAEDAEEPKKVFQWTDLPLELRHTIYDKLNERVDGPEHVLRDWLDKTEGLIPAPADDQNTDASNADGEIEGEDGDDEDEDVGDGHGDDENEGAADGMNEEHDEESKSDYDEEVDEFPGIAESHGNGEVPEMDAEEGADGDLDMQSPADGPENEEVEGIGEQEDEQDENGEVDEDEDSEDSEDSEDDEDDQDSDEDEDDADANPAPAAYGVSGTVNSPPKTIVKRPHTKFRHAVGIFELSACPPPVNVLLLNRQTKDEAIEHYYNTATFIINVSQGFRHFSFFEETIELFNQKAFSPLEQIRKCTIRFVWDAELMDGSDIDEGVRIMYDDMLRLRAGKVEATLRMAPHLEEMTIEWHDSLNCNCSTELAHGYVFRLPLCQNIVANAQLASWRTSSILHRRRI